MIVVYCSVVLRLISFSYIFMNINVYLFVVEDVLNSCKIIYFYAVSLPFFIVNCGPIGYRHTLLLHIFCMYFVLIWYLTDRLYFKSFILFTKFLFHPNASLIGWRRWETYLTFFFTNKCHKIEYNLNSLATICCLTASPMGTDSNIIKKTIHYLDRRSPNFH